MNLKSRNHVAVVKNRKEKRQRLRVGDPGFKPPDGGWGWLLVVACGFGNLCSFPMFHQFGLVFKKKFALVGINSSETLSILNYCVAFNTGIGLLNGPIFRLFSQRQVALMSACGVVVSLAVLSFCVEFWSHVLMYSICYGASFGMLEAANSLAINTYFEEKRRSATGYSWTLTGLGPIVCPYIIVYLDQVYGVNGVVFIFAGFAMHSFMCGLFLQPVEWHTEYKDTSKEPNDANKSIEDEKIISRNSPISKQFFSNEGYCSSETNTPTLAPKLAQPNNSTKDHYQENIIASRVLDLVNETDKDKKLSINEPTTDDDVFENQPDKVPSMVNEIPAISFRGMSKKQPDDEAPEEPTVNAETMAAIDAEQNPISSEEKLNIWRTFYAYFDIDLLKDPTYVILNLGLTFANVTEMNFSLGTPIILEEFHFDTYQIANFMSLVAVTDLIVRFISSVVADKIGWSNRTYFLLGVMSMALGRVVLVHTQTFSMGMVAAVIIGSGKALRTIFMILVIPSHVPLERLPAAYGLQFAVSGITFIIMGPVVGWIRQLTGNYVITLHILNMCTYLTAISWTIDSWLAHRRKKIDNIKSID